jgi:NADH-quinone oxidoreductase subunit H
VPWPISAIDHGLFNRGWWGLLWFLVKLLIFLFGFIWLRATLPRLRYDQFMRLGWKVLLPANLVWILVVSGIRTLQLHNNGGNTRWYIVIGVVLVALIVLFLWPSTTKPVERSVADLEAEHAARPEGSFPLPPMNLEVPPSPRLQRVTGERQPAAVGGGTGEADAGDEKEES